MERKNTEFEFRGINHLALVCRDMERTVDFYSNVLGMPLMKTIELPNNMGQHFFFDIGNGDSLAFFWFPNAPEAAPGIAAPAGMPGEGELATAHGSMNHVAFDVPPEKFDEYYEKIKAKGIPVTPILNHDDSPRQVSREVHEGTFIRSFYFQDPDGILLEFACWLRAMGPDDVKHKPARAADRDRYLGLVGTGGS
ncbi:VOC family protein [Tepidiforma flava]|uniref:VOC family protein n=1 Tax=Tepidiforma flava TaxID=3004094 RepID=A0ABY7M5W4_9CHLR|nr:VOC family protein [Tepidiforma flava]WBL35903.1 VOC family protein [Tepidiforma flava]